METCAVYVGIASEAVQQQAPWCFRSYDWGPRLEEAMVWKWRRLVGSGECLVRAWERGSLQSMKMAALASLLTCWLPLL